MRLTAKSEYGVLALIDLASRQAGTPSSAREVAERQGIPATFLEQLFVSLRQAGLVQARRGAHGGFLLGRTAGEITVLDVVEALEGPLQPTVCDGSSSCARSQACAAVTVWRRAAQALRDVFETTTIGELAAAQAALDARPGESREG